MKKTPFYEDHIKAGGKMVEFAGFSLPVQYKGVKDEHFTVRKHAGMFDVSHMGQVFITGENAFESVQNLTPNDVSKLVSGKAQYSMFLKEDGTIVDDTIVYKISDKEYLLVVNASNLEKDFNWIKNHLEPNAKAENRSDDYAMLAVQGPEAVSIVQGLTDADVSGLPYFSFLVGTVAECENVFVARTGYTGEDGFEIMCDPKDASKLWNALLNAGVVPAGLGARDTLRLEAKMSLYGNEIDETTNPLEASLSWVIKMDKSGFIGKDSLIKIKEEGLKRKLVGFEMMDPGIARHGYKIKFDGKEVGFVTSGVMSPTLGKAIGLGYVPKELSSIGSEFSIDIRGRERQARVIKTPFYKRSN